MVPLLSIVGKSGVGKTTLLEKLIGELVQRGVRVVVIKHHAHSTPIDPPGKDSARFAAAGAAGVWVASPVELVRFQRTTRELRLAEIAARVTEGDLILAEGFKNEPGPKLEVSRADLTVELLSSPEDLVAVASDHEVAVDVPRFELDDVRPIADLICARFLADPPKREARQEPEGVS